jgi:hypothetical protein
MIKPLVRIRSRARRAAVGERADVFHGNRFRPSSLRRFVVTVTITMLFYSAFTVLGIYYSQGNDPRIPQPGTRASATIVVQNKVAIAAKGLSEDRTQVYLSTRPVDRCGRRGCKIPGTEMDSGAILTAVCFTLGTGMTNMDLASASARRNPERVSSDLWYGVPLPDGALGLVSEVYLTEPSRNGLGLPRCESYPSRAPR